eukprot:gene745-1427_t
MRDCASDRRKRRVEKLLFQRKRREELNVPIYPVSSSIESRKIRNRESAAASRLQRIKQYEDMQLRCAQLENENNSLRMRLQRIEESMGQSLIFEPAVFPAVETTIVPNFPIDPVEYPWDDVCFNHNDIHDHLKTAISGAQESFPSLVRDNWDVDDAILDILDDMFA